ncbi:hypothetical protein BDV38DRAFT_279154 [Aspergillus pseudotamarii]|uniref:NACHT domain-containing protein n=1 Tax=Aspergillus pseudotamarii TaxID=132259 RepID=A0A5N6T4L4_ASPPS|nr:uncharacterized protein BDV38DRAFT_279154 [Aspergillus pseudotamarii]KAE8141248.1 hypothetical protein BDV38DRAFT_279154 [Aspergillus pseudotamarii]
MTSRSRTHNDYTVGLVCALAKEQTAAIAMLDERHEDLLNPAHDHNAYTLGSMSNHNVVIACLPKGEVGTNSAATVATRMISTFPSIRFGLMVGIGGGVPPKVRLGDVVVSTPAGGFPGVVQWDMGKAEQRQTFRQTGVLNNPPSALLTALTKLESKHDMEGSSIPQYLDDLMIKWPKLAPRYSKSEKLEDVCFEADYDHVTAITTHSDKGLGKKRNHDGQMIKQEATDCRFCDRRRTLKRQPQDMLVHYGLIASGNQVIKDAVFRDRINARLGGDVLCFEMEAAGLMNSFPCAIIRGICDYCDSHKNKDWQEHAAGVAAAFAKEFLSVIPPTQVTETPAAAEVMKAMSDTVHKIGKYADTIRHDVYLLQSSQEDQYRKTLRCWLSPIDYETIQNDTYRNYQEGTGKWFLDHPKFQRWVASPSQTLFCPGIPGAGKTMMASMVVNHLRSKFLHNSCSQHDRIGIAFIYCSYERQSEQKSDDLFASLLSQLALEESPIPLSISKLYNRHHQGRARPSLREISNELYSTIAKYSTVFIVIDALDECRDNTTRKILLSELFQLQQITDIRLMLTSRPNISPEHHSVLDIHADEKDIQQYLRRQMNHLSRVVEGDETLQHEIQARILESANGMFLLAQLYITSLEDKNTKKAIYRQLDKMVTGHQGLDQAYNGAFQRIRGDLAKALLSWVVCARKLLTGDELLHALAVEPGTRSLDTTNFCDLQEIVSSCAGLVVLDPVSKNVRLVHNTAKDYFQQKIHEYFPYAHTNIAVSCLTYLGYDAFKSGACPNDKAFETRLQQYPLLDYASRYWADHSRGVEESVKDVAIAFLMEEKNAFAASQCLFTPEFRHASYSRKIPIEFTGMHLVAYFGLHHLLIQLLEKLPVDIVDCYGRTPLSYAAERGHALAVSQLVDNGAKVNSRDRNGGTALHYAAWKGHDAIVALLLRKGADVNIRDSGWGTPLTRAIDGKSETTLKIILREKPRMEFVYSPFAQFADEDLPVQLQSLLRPWRQIPASKERYKFSYEDLPEYLEVMGRPKGKIRRGLNITPNLHERHGFPSSKIISPYQVERRIFLPLGFEIITQDEPLLNDGLQFLWRDYYLGQPYKDGDSDVPRNVGYPSTGWLLDDLFFTPLLRAVWKRNYPALKLLLENGCCPHFGNSRGLTPLLLATKLKDDTSSVMLERSCFRSGWLYGSANDLQSISPFRK